MRLADFRESDSALRSSFHLSGNKHEEKMNRLKLYISVALSAVLAFSLCTKVDFSNPIDSKGTSYMGDSASAITANGIAAYYDTTSTWYKNHKGEILQQSTPVITFIGVTAPDTVIVAHNGNLKGFSFGASDPIYGNLTNSVTWTGNFYLSVCSTYVVIYSVTNPASNTVHKPLYIIVDCSPPELTVLGDNPMSLAMGKAYVEPGATATDNIDGTISSSKIVITGTVDITKAGSDTVTYTVSDRAGNKTVVQRVVNVFIAQVVDSIAPVITLNGVNPMSVALNGIYSEPGATATDNIDGPISSSKIIITGAVTTTLAGSYSVIYRVSDNAGNQATKTRTVIVSGGVIPGDSLPVITLTPPNPDTILVGSTYNEPGATVTDKKDGTIPFSSVVITGINGKPVSVSTTLGGVTYTLVYNVKDKAGNAANAVTRTVVVVGVTIPDTTKPIITLGGHGADTVLMGATFTDTSATAVDDIDGNITAKIKATLTTAAGAAASMTTFTSAAGSYKITYTVSDAAGNAAVPAIRTILVQDTTGLGTNLKMKYGVPLTTALPSIANTTYKTITVDGKGPSMSAVTSFALNWDLTNKGLYGFNFTYTGSPYYMSFTSMTQNFSQPSPQFTISGTTISGLDGSYYIKADATQCTWVRTDGTFAIIFKP
jgi:hypothetical protein